MPVSHSEGGAIWLVTLYNTRNIPRGRVKDTGIVNTSTLSSSCIIDRSSSSSYPPPLWNGAFCTLGCKTQSAHEAVANITQWVGPAFHGETIPLGGYPRTGKTWNWNIYRDYLKTKSYLKSFFRGLQGLLRCAERGEYSEELRIGL